MKHLIFSVRELSQASRFFREISLVPISGTLTLALSEELAELQLQVTNLRRLEPLVSDQRAKVSGIARKTNYQVWLADQKREPVYLGAFNTPQLAQGTFYTAIDYRNAAYSECSLKEFRWLLVLAGHGAGGSAHFPDDMAQGVFYIDLEGDTVAGTYTSSPQVLFSADKKKDDDEELDYYYDDEDDVDDDEDIDDDYPEQ